MYSIRKLLLVLGFISCCLQAQGADKYTDENRPYEFGFKIDGEQHRHEKKDENGIIMGEFGFITADGVYHVTVYATDENGNFKILSMKNMRVKPYPTNTGAEKKGHSLPFPPSQNPPQTQGPARQAPGPPALQAPAPTTRAKTCSSCSIPAPKPGPTLTDIAVVAQNNQQQPYDPNSQFGQKPSGPQVYPTGQQAYPNYPQNAQTNPIPGSNRQQNNPNYAQQGQNGPQQGNQNYPQQGQSGFSQPPSNYPQQDLLPPQQGGGGFEQGGGGFGQGGGSFGQVGQGGPGGQGRQGAQGGPGGQGRQGGQGAQGGPGNQYSGQNPGSPGDRNPKRIDNYPQQSPGSSTGSQGSSPQKPILISAQMQIVDKSTDIYHKNPGEKDGLPQGLSKNDMVQLLYTFNYTVGFHAHFEEGYSDGSKQGYYYVTGRNGVRTRVDYVADEKGFRPKITEEVLDLLSDDVPKPETEKDEKFGLKGYEFKWLYYPEESKQR